MVAGTGTSNDPFLLYDFSDLEQIHILGLNKYYKLANDIDASSTSEPDYNGGAGWLPITGFTGNFNGDNKKITGLYINRPDTDNIGLFGTSSGFIYDLNIIEGEITGKNFVGGIVGYLNQPRDVIGCSFKGDVSGQDNIGGIVGGTYSSTAGTCVISGCSFEGNVSGVNSIGGIAGIHNMAGSGSVIELCNVKGGITGTGNNIGGVVGNCKANVQNIDLSDVIINTASTSNNVGGIIGYLNAQKNVLGCSFKGDVSGQDNIGGIVGGTYSSTAGTCVISGCSFEGNVSGVNSIGGIAGAFQSSHYSSVIELCNVKGVITGTGQYAGGLIGYNRGNVKNCYSEMTINGVNHVGGLIGRQYSNDLENSYSRGEVNGTSNVGGLVGSNNNRIATSCYWDTETSGQPTSVLGTGKTTLEMKTQATFIDWDFETPIWVISSLYNEGYPFLIDLFFAHVLSDVGNISSTEIFGCD